MKETSSAGLRLPVQAAIDRTRTYGTFADGSGVEASINFGDLLRPIIMDNWTPPPAVQTLLGLMNMG
jgi:hypothetical protein